MAHAEPADAVRETPAAKPADAVLGDLTPEQHAAVTHGEGPLLVVAGPGSGKTRVITRRVAQLIRSGLARPWEILAITFTNKAAGEMRARIASLLGATPDAAGVSAGGVYVATFHSFCARWLRRLGPMSRTQGFTIYDEDDQKACVRQALDEQRLDDRQWKPGSLLSEISALKNRMESPEDIAARAYAWRDRVVASVYATYEKLLAEWNAFDFDDLLLEMVRVLDGREAARREIEDRFRYVLVDEFQDTNRPQYRIAKLLAGERRNLCVVGDPDQSIYKWRGAEIRNILDFKRDHPDANVVPLGRNYRSTKKILAAAQGLIEHNAERLEKTLSTENEAGEEIRVVACLTESEEARFVALEIEDAVRERGVEPGDVAVFYRTNALSRKIEEELVARGRRYAVVGSLAFYERKEVKDVLAYLRLLANPRDEGAVLRAGKAPPRGIGTGTVERLRAVAKTASAATLLDAMRLAAAPKDKSEALGSRAERALAGFVALVDELAVLAADPSAGVAPLVEAAAERSGYLDSLRGSTDPQDRVRIENVRALIDAAAEFDRQGLLRGDTPLVPPGLEGAAEPRTFAHFLDHVALLSDVDRTRPGPDRVNLMTFHAAKGLEFDEVFVIGCEAGLFPLEREMEETDVEEERRLFYVALTRARKRVTVAYARVRRYYGSERMNRPSPFLAELPEELLEKLGGAAVDASLAYAPAGRPSTTRPSVAGERSGGPFRIDRPLPSYAASSGGRGASDLRPGDRVDHPHFGRGKVIEVSGAGLASRVKVSFEKTGEVKTLVSHYANLRRC